MRRLILCVTAAALLALPARAVAATTASGSPVPPDLERFFAYRRPARYSSLRLEVQVPTRDGTHLGCYLYEPEVKGMSFPAPGRFPGIIDNFSPYYLAYPFNAFDGAYFAEHGYLDLECTPRGIGLSEGTFQGWLSAIENNDNYDLIEWLVHQPDSTGQVAQEGDSYGGMSAYRVASLHPPGLVTIAPQQTHDSLYLDFAYPGGIRSLGDPDWYAFTGAVGVGRSLLSTQEQAWLQHPLLDDYWRQIDIDTKWRQIDLPILGFGGWLDLFQDGMARNYLGLQGPNTYLIEGPWTHGSTFDSTVTKGALLAWFDHWLYHDPRAPMPPTHVASYVMPNGPWQELGAWPVAQAHDQSLALMASGALAAQPSPPGRSGHVSYVVNTGAGAVDLPSRDHLVFAGSPQSTAATIGGAGILRLAATLTDPTGTIAATEGYADTSQFVDTDFVVHLYDAAPSGTQTLITRGYLKASQYLSHSYPARIPLGRPIDYSIPLWHVDYRIAAGHHLVLLLETGEQSCCESSAPALSQPLFPLTVTVATGRGGSTLTLPVAVG
jgi:predicted acyl esterase